MEGSSIFFKDHLHCSKYYERVYKRHIPKMKIERSKRKETPIGTLHENHQPQIERRSVRPVHRRGEELWFFRW